MWITNSDEQILQVQTERVLFPVGECGVTRCMKSTREGGDDKMMVCTVTSRRTMRVFRVSSALLRWQPFLRPGRFSSTRIRTRWTKISRREESYQARSEGKCQTEDQEAFFGACAENQSISFVGRRGWDLQGPLRQDSARTRAARTSTCLSVNRLSVTDVIRFLKHRVSQCR